jgi:hypothetical protein
VIENENVRERQASGTSEISDSGDIITLKEMIMHTVTKRLTKSDSSSDDCKRVTRPKRGKYRNYDQGNLLEAVKAVQRGEMSVHRAGTFYGVPHSTLEYKVKERHLLRPRKRPRKDKAPTPPSADEVSESDSEEIKPPVNDEIPDGAKCPTGKLPETFQPFFPLPYGFPYMFPTQQAYFPPTLVNPLGEWMARSPLRGPSYEDDLRAAIVAMEKAVQDDN